MSNEAPFYIGQEVVALKSSQVHQSGQSIIKGNTYTCAGCYWASCCKKWLMAVGETDAVLDETLCIDHFSYTKHKGVFKLLASAKYFAPVSRLRISDKLTIAADLLCPQVEERADVQPEKIEA